MTLVWHWPQIVWVALAASGVLMAVDRHGKERTVMASFWVTIAGTAIMATVLYYGGFFAGVSP